MRQPYALLVITSRFVNLPSSGREGWYLACLRYSLKRPRPGLHGCGTPSSKPLQDFGLCFTRSAKGCLEILLAELIKTRHIHSRCRVKGYVCTCVYMYRYSIVIFILSSLVIIDVIITHCRLGRYTCRYGCMALAGSLFMALTAQPMPTPDALDGCGGLHEALFRRFD